MRNEKLRQIRIQKGFTQEQISRKMGYRSKSSYCMLENGLTEMSIKKAKKICSILDIPLTVLLVEDEAEAEISCI